MMRETVRDKRQDLHSLLSSSSLGLRLRILHGGALGIARPLQMQGQHQQRSHPNLRADAP